MDFKEFSEVLVQCLSNEYDADVVRDDNKGLIVLNGKHKTKGYECYISTDKDILFKAFGLLSKTVDDFDD